MLVTETKLEREIREKQEADRLRAIAEDKEKQREFELEKARIETSVPQRWMGMKSIVDSITYVLWIPVYMLWVLGITLLLLCKREVPEFFHKI